MTLPPNMANPASGPSKPLPTSAPAVPPDKADRRRLQQLAEVFTREHALTAPLGPDELAEAGAAFLAELGLPQTWRPFAMVVLNNAVWTADFSRVPPSRRLLLLPQCLRNPQACTAQADELGILCRG